METAEKILIKHIKHPHLASLKYIDTFETRVDYALDAMEEYADQFKLKWISVEELENFMLPDFTEVFGYSEHTEKTYWNCSVMTHSIHPKTKYIMGPGSIKITHFMLPPENPKINGRS